jgi:hypothetical protein
LLAQFMHVSSTSSLVIFSATRVSAAQEVMCYGLYGVSLWLAVTIVSKMWGNRLSRRLA